MIRAHGPHVGKVVRYRTAQAITWISRDAPKSDAEFGGSGGNGCELARRSISDDRHEPSTHSRQYRDGKRGS